MKMKTNINALCLLIIALCYINKTEAATCSALFGPNGARQCIKIPGYTDYQWATCRRDSYLKSTSGGRHHCSHPFHTYCLYQCMLEKHDKTSGDVKGNCLCTPSSTVPTSSPSPPVSTSSPSPPVTTSSPSSPAFTSSPRKTGQCDAYRGPNGARQCIKISGYTDYQWVTCRTDSYLKSTSGGRHHCRNPLHIYCLYQCMVEMYDRSSGDVLSSCRCTPGENSASQKEKYTLVFVVFVAITSMLVS